MRYLLTIKFTFEKRMENKCENLYDLGRGNYGVGTLTTG